VGWFCKSLTIAFALAYALALLVFLTGTFGLFGQKRDPLSGVFLLPLGFPWVYLVDMAPKSAWPLLAALAPTLNLALILGVCLFRSRR
jgi:hypothetical protein